MKKIIALIFGILVFIIIGWAWYVSQRPFSFKVQSVSQKQSENKGTIKASQKQSENKGTIKSLSNVLCGRADGTTSVGLSDGLWNESLFNLDPEIFCINGYASGLRLDDTSNTRNRECYAYSSGSTHSSGSFATTCSSIQETDFAGCQIVISEENGEEIGRFYGYSGYESRSITIEEGDYNIFCTGINGTHIFHSSLMNNRNRFDRTHFLNNSENFINLNNGNQFIAMCGGLSGCSVNINVITGSCIARGNVNGYNSGQVMTGSCLPDYSALDLDGDCVISTGDIGILRNYILSITPMPDDISSYDLNKDGKLSTFDLTLLLRAIINNAINFEVEGDGIDNNCDGVFS